MVLSCQSLQIEIGGEKFTFHVAVAPTNNIINPVYSCNQDLVEHK